MIAMVHMPHFWLRFRFAAGCFLQAISLLAFSAQLPYYAPLPELAVCTWIRACLTIIQTFLAIANFHLLTDHSGLSIRVVTTLHPYLPQFISRLPTIMALSYVASVNHLYSGISSAAMYLARRSSSVNNMYSSPSMITSVPPNSL